MCVLSVLRRGDSYGYRIIRELSGSIAVSESTLYPILRRLEAGGLLTDYSVEHNGRLRKFYRVTDAGRAMLEEFIENLQEMIDILEFIKGGRENDA